MFGKQNKKQVQDLKVEPSLETTKELAQLKTMDDKQPNWVIRVLATMGWIFLLILIVSVFYQLLPQVFVMLAATLGFYDVENISLLDYMVFGLSGMSIMLLLTYLLLKYFINPVVGLITRTISSIIRTFRIQKQYKKSVKPSKK